MFDCIECVIYEYLTRDKSSEQNFAAHKRRLRLIQFSINILIRLLKNSAISTIRSNNMFKMHCSILIIKLCKAHKIIIAITKC